MGLDMYLSAKRYLSKYDKQENEAREEINKIPLVAGLGVPVKEITVDAMYWRKVNAIHNWFVEKCQDGIDECQETYVSKEQLQTLLELCRQVYETRDATPLPPTAGFFFGSTDIDEYYFEDIKGTIEGLNKLLSAPDVDDWSFYYQASW